MKITLLHPSRGRAKKSFDNSMDWIQKASGHVELIVSIDKSDDWKAYEDAYNASFCGGEIRRISIDHRLHYTFFGIVNENNSVVEATNAAARHAMEILRHDKPVSAHDHIFLYLSEDFKCFDGWDDAIREQFENENRPLLVKADDGLQGFEVPVLTIPIMNRALYERLGYFWHPGYKSMFTDNDLYWTTRSIGALKYAPHLKFKHEHPCNGKAPDDETYRRSAANWTQGERLFKLRKDQGFPI